jgi:hypothetical protein
MSELMVLEVDSKHLNYKKFQARVDAYNSLINELSERELDQDICDEINAITEDLKQSQLESKKLRKHIRKMIHKILLILQKKLGITPKGHYLALWMGLGLAIFGVPLGVAFGVAMGNMGLLGIGIGAALPIGMAIGAGLDKKAEKEGQTIKL